MKNQGKFSSLAPVLAIRPLSGQIELRLAVERAGFGAHLV